MPLCPRMKGLREERERERGGGRAFGEEEENSRGGDGEVEGIALLGY